jgi:hypothetical protein
MAWFANLGTDLGLSNFSTIAFVALISSSIYFGILCYSFISTARRD